MIEAIEEFRKLDVRNELSFTPTSKLRMLVEAIFFGWFYQLGIKSLLTRQSKRTFNRYV